MDFVIALVVIYIVVVVSIFVYVHYVNAKRRQGFVKLP